jgi:hypothetical protein
MPPFRDHDDDDDDDWEAGEGENGDGWDDSDDEPTVACPSCGREILEDSPRCPFCERYVSEEDHPAPRRPGWVIATALICLGIAVWWVLAAF